MAQETQSKSASNTRLASIIRILNFVVAGLVIGFGLTGLIYMGVNGIFKGNFLLVFSPIFTIFFGIMIIVTEFRYDFMTDTFGFLKNLIGRGIFNIYLASAVFYYFAFYSNAYWVGWVLAVILFVLGFVYFGLHLCGDRIQNKEQAPVKEVMMT